MAYTYTLGPTYQWGTQDVMTINVVADAAAGSIVPVPANTPVVVASCNKAGTAPAAGPGVGYALSTGTLAFSAMDVATYNVVLVLV